MANGGWPNLSKFRFLVVTALATASLAMFAYGVNQISRSDVKTRILLLGDSTTRGSICRKVDPAGPHLEQIIAQGLQGRTGLPAEGLEVINQGRDGEFIEALLSSGRYAREISHLGKFAVICVRYGSNDLVFRDRFTVNFTNDYQKLIARLREDFPDAQIILSLVVPYQGPEKDETINAMIRAVAEAENLPLFDPYTPYLATLAASGPNSLCYRHYPLAKIPEDKRPLAAPFTRDGMVTVMDNRLDPHFGHLPGWYQERHPNLAGYHVIGEALAEFLAPTLKKPIDQAH